MSTILKQVAAVNLPGKTIAVSTAITGPVWPGTNAITTGACASAHRVMALAGRECHSSPNAEIIGRAKLIMRNRREPPQVESHWQVDLVVQRTIGLVVSGYLIASTSFAAG